MANPIDQEAQADGRIRYWGFVAYPGVDERRVLRVVTLEHGETVHNAFFGAVAKSTSFRWRHRFWRAEVASKDALGGIVEDDEAFFLALRQRLQALAQPPGQTSGPAAEAARDASPEAGPDGRAGPGAGRPRPPGRHPRRRA